MGNGHPWLITLRSLNKVGPLPAGRLALVRMGNGHAAGFQATLRILLNIHKLTSTLRLHVVCIDPLLAL